MTAHHPTGLDDHDVPPALADALESAFALPDPPRTLQDWVVGVTDHLDGALAVGPADLCATDESPHVADVAGERLHFHCVFDALVVPFLAPDAPVVDVRSRSPVSGGTVELAVTRDAVDAKPPDAVMSFGLARGTEVRDPGDVSPALAYERLCPYVNAFHSVDEYGQWAAETPDAATMPVAFPAGLELAETLAAPASEPAD